MLQAIADYPGSRPGGVEMAGLLIDVGADVNARVQHEKIEVCRETPLHWAASDDDVDLAELLLDEGAEIDSDQGVIANGTPVWNAVIFGCVNVANLLIDRGASSILMIAAGAGRRELVEQYFDAKGDVVAGAGALPCWEDPRSSKAALDSAFGFACRNGHVTIARRLFERGADPMWVNPVGETALKQAQKGGHRTVVSWLKAHGIEP